MKRTNSLFAALLTTALFAAAPAQAMMGKHDVKQCDKNMKKMMSTLDLSKDQHHAITELKDTQHERMENHQKEMKEIKKAIKAQVKSDNFDEAEVRRLAEKKAAMMVEMTVAMAKTKNGIRSHLSDEQISKMEEFQKKHHEKMKEMKKKHHAH